MEEMGAEPQIMKFKVVENPRHGQCYHKKLMEYNSA